MIKHFQGADASLVPSYVKHISKDKSYVVLAENERMAEELKDLMDFFHKGPSFVYPSWGLNPYDRTSPHAEVLAKRQEVVSFLQKGIFEKPFVLITTVEALMQRIPPKESAYEGIQFLEKGSRVCIESLCKHLLALGFEISESVYETGQFAVRGGLLDLFLPSMEKPLRVDFFGDEVEGIRYFDCLSQKSEDVYEGIVSLFPAKEILLTEEAIKSFRHKYLMAFGAKAKEDTLYQSISEGVYAQGYEYWMPLFYDHLSTLFDFLPEAINFLVPSDLNSLLSHAFEQVKDHFEDRKHALTAFLEEELVYRPVPPRDLYLTPEEMAEKISPLIVATFGFMDAGSQSSSTCVKRYKPVPSFYKDQRSGRQGMEEALKAFMETAKHPIFASGESDHSLKALASLLEHYGFKSKVVSSPSSVSGGIIGLFKGNISKGGITPYYSLITYEELLGPDTKKSGRKKSFKELSLEFSAFKKGDYLVHREHGVGQFEELKTLEVGGARHDCLLLYYAKGDRLYVPVENIGVLSFFGQGENVSLDQLGGAGWKTKKTRLKKHLLEMSGKLIDIAALRAEAKGISYAPDKEAYEMFCKSFPFVETEDQERAIEEVLSDLGSGKPMDRLVCGDVGFGKTEVALRAAFVVASEGSQVVILVPTTLLANQHYEVFKERLSPFGIRVASLSRFQSPKASKAIKEDLTEGKVNVLIATHAVLSKSIKFKDLGLAIIDEEQHFGVKQKERLKENFPLAHVLSMSATPIPRTLQMSLTGLRELSLIATPPLDRKSVHTFILPFDRIAIRDALLREHHRGGQSIYVCPRVSDIEPLREKLQELVPDLKLGVAHGQLSSNDLEEVMGAFCHGRYDILLATNIVESGLDIPKANTLIVHKANMFGLGQLYQLRGRVGRSKARGYAYFTFKGDRLLTKQARKRLEVMRSLDGLGAGFALASHDMDIRGVGNVLGEAQSGHIKEVGIELYQQMLQEALEEKRKVEGLDQASESFQPQINLDFDVLLPDTYIADLSLRMGIYRRLGDILEVDGVDELREELKDRFGPLPSPAENLLEVLKLKCLARKAYVEKIDVGQKGILFSFYKDTFPAPEALLSFIMESKGAVQFRPDSKVLLVGGGKNIKLQMKSIENFLKEAIRCLGRDK